MVPDHEPTSFATCNDFRALVVDCKLPVGDGAGPQAGHTCASASGLSVFWPGPFSHSGSLRSHECLAVRLKPWRKDIDGEVDARNPELCLSVGNAKRDHALLKVVSCRLKPSRREEESTKIDRYTRLVRWPVLRIEEVPFGAVLAGVDGEPHPAASAHGERDAMPLYHHVGIRSNRFCFGLSQVGAKFGRDVGGDCELQAIEPRVQYFCGHLRSPSPSYLWRGVLQDPPPFRSSLGRARFARRVGRSAPSRASGGAALVLRPGLRGGGGCGGARDQARAPFGAIRPQNPVRCCQPRTGKTHAELVCERRRSSVHSTISRQRYRTDRPIL